MSDQSPAPGELEYVAFTFHDDVLGLELHISAPLEEPLTFTIQGDVSDEQFEEILSKTSFTETEVTDIYDEVADFLRDFMFETLGPRNEELEHVGAMMGVMAWFDAGVACLIEDMQRMLTTAQDHWPFMHKAQQEKKQDNEDLKRQLRYLRESMDTEVRAQNENINRHCSTVTGIS